MKKRIISCILFLLVISMLLSSCSEFTPAVDPNGNNERPTQNEQPSESTPPAEDDGSYTVTLSYNGEQYIPTSDTEIYVQWNDGFSFHKALMEDGVAKVGNLDGDFQVTLSAVPEGFAYDPNAYIATTDNRHIEIKLHKVIETFGAGEELYKSISIDQMGVYKVDIDVDRRGNVKEIFYEFAPKEPGLYSVESWVDTTENQINPTANFYGENSAFKQLVEVCDGGGMESTYTKNFKLEVDISDSEFSKDGGGQVIFSFGITATSKKGEYPISVYFAVKLDGEMPDDGTSKKEATIMVPKEELVHQRSYPTEYYSTAEGNYSIEYILTGAEFKQMNSTGDKTANVFDSDNYSLWKKGTGMPMSAIGTRGDSIAQKLTGEYTVTYESIIRSITFTPDKVGATSGAVTIRERDTSMPEALIPYTTYEGVYRYEFVKGNPDKKIPDTIALTHISGDKIEYAGFSIDKNGNLTYGVGDNYYHLIDKENGTYGPILYAYITSDCGFLGGETFATLEYRGNKALTVTKDKNYKLFIEGFNALTISHGDVGPYFCYAECPCRKGIKDDNGKEIKKPCTGACVEGCQYCLADCRPCPEEGIGHPGYAGYVNYQGMYGVTEELKIFLQSYSIAQLLFFDGNGFVETNEDRNVYAEEDDQWLFACAYYKKTVVGGG